MNKEKYLPLGTVVLLKGAQKRVMIIGFMATTNEKNKTFDYMGCLYPVGVLNSEQTLVFNHDQIDKIFYMGYSDSEEKEFKEKLNTLVNEENI